MANQKQARSGQARTGTGRAQAGRAATGTGAAGARSAGASAGSARAKAGAAAKTGAAKTSAAKPTTGSAGAGAEASAEASAGTGRGLWNWMVTRKLEFATLVLSLAGMGVSIYMTIEHFSEKPSYAGCTAGSGAVSCAKVTTSAQSHFLGMPVAVLGLAFFVFMVAICLPWAWRAAQPAVHWARLAAVVIGIVFVLWLVYAELFLIGSICLYCTSVHVLTFLLFALVVSRVAVWGLKPRI